MTSPVGVIGLNFAGYDVQRADLNVMFEITEGLDELPAVRGSDELIPFRSGRLSQKRTADHRPLVLTGWIAGAGATPEASYRAYLDGLKKVLDPTRDPGLLVATLTDGSVRWIRAVPRDLIGGDRIGYEFRPLSVELDALDPYWYGPYGSASLNSGLFLDTGHYLDEGASIVVVPTSGAHPVAVDTLGTAQVERVSVTFTGPSVSGVGIENTTNGTGFVLPSIAANPVTSPPRVTVVDNFARTVLDWLGATLRASLVLNPANAHGEYLRLEPGLNNLRILGKPAAARILFTPTYE
jgi:hypothetical protein